MPELPEVETMRRGVAGVVGGRIVEVERCRLNVRPILLAPSGARFTKRLIGRTIVAVDRLGKRVVVRLDDQAAIVFEPRMTGLVLVADPPTREHLRLRILLAPAPGRQCRELLYWDRRGLGLVRVLSPAELEKCYGAEKLGPDALQITSDALRERLADSRRAIKVALLDQRVLAGVGNLYASEILHLCGVHPESRCDRLLPEQWEAMHHAMRKILHDAIRHEGSTLSDGTYRNALNQQGGYQNHHRVYDRAGKPCGQCDEPIVRIVQAQRSTFFCPSCQGKRRSAKAR